MRLERREFLKQSGFWVAVAASGQLIPASSELPKRSLQTPTPEKPRELSLGKQKLNQEIDNLPQSPIKNLLVQRIKPYYGPGYPKTVNFGGLEINIQNPQVLLRTENINQVSGRFTFRGGLAPSEPLYPAQTTVARLPYVGLLLESEKKDVPPQNIAPDGTPFIEITFEPEQPFYTGFSPLMEITTPDPKFIKPEYRKLYEVFERFIYLKEACSHLVFDLWTEETVKKMQALSLRTSIEARRADNTRVIAEIVSQSINTIHLNNGRIAAAIGLAAVIVASKAVEGTELVDPRLMDEDFKRVYPSIRKFNLGESPQDILYNSLHWALTAPEARLLDHVGNLDKIP